MSIFGSLFSFGKKNGNGYVNHKHCNLVQEKIGEQNKNLHGRIDTLETNNIQRHNDIKDLIKATYKK